MFKPLLIAFFSLHAFAGSVYGQKDTSFTEFGLNATPFVNQYLDFGSGNGEFSSPYMITWEHSFGRIGIRAGAGLTSAGDKEHPDDDNTRPETVTITTSGDLRTGVVFYRGLSPRWSLKYGVDGIFAYDKNSIATTVTNTFGDKVTSTTAQLAWEGGASPFFFVQFHITPHFSIGTELLGKAAYRMSVDKEENSEFPQFSDRIETTGTRFSISPPTALYFIFRI